MQLLVALGWRTVHKRAASVLLYLSLCHPAARANLFEAKKKQAEEAAERRGGMAPLAPGGQVPMTIDKLFDNLSGSGGYSETKCFKENLGVLQGMIASRESKVQIVLDTGAACSL